MTRSGSARTARPISRSSISPALRAIPHLKVFRPCDAVETVECWQLALESKDAPSVLALSRGRTCRSCALGFDARNFCARGAYELIAGADDAPVVSLFATGSEVAIAVAAQKLLAARKDLGAGGLGAVLRAAAGAARRRAGGDHRRRRRQCRGRSRHPPRLGRDHRLRRRFRRHDRLSAPAGPPRSFTNISGLQPRRWPRRHWLDYEDGRYKSAALV